MAQSPRRILRTATRTVLTPRLALSQRPPVDPLERPRRNRRTLQLDISPANMQCVRVLPLLNNLSQRNVGRERLAGQPRAAGLVSLRSSQDWMAARSYVCPSVVVAGSRMISSVIGQKKAGRRLPACGCSMPLDDKYFFDVTEILYQRGLNFCTKLFFFSF